MQTDFGGAKDSPHPLPVPVRLSYEDAYAEPLPIPSSILPRPGSHSRWDPASPTALSRLLSAISPRESPAAGSPPRPSRADVALRSKAARGGLGNVGSGAKGVDHAFDERARGDEA